jgi:hypothetical protein
MCRLVYAHWSFKRTLCILLQCWNSGNQYKGFPQRCHPERSLGVCFYDAEVRNPNYSVLSFISLFLKIDCKEIMYSLFEDNLQIILLINWNKYLHNGKSEIQRGWWVLSPTRKETSYSDRRLWCSYRGDDKSLARPGRKQATTTEDFDVHISYLQS